MLFEAGGSAAPPIPPPVSAPGAARITSTLRPAAGGLRIPKAPTEESAPVEVESPPLATPVPNRRVTEFLKRSAEVESPPLVAPIAPAAVGSAFCKFHPKTPARFLCDRCQKYFCDLCVTTRNVGDVAGKFCRACGTECIPVQVNITRGTGEKGFYALLPGAFIYPFRGGGVFVLIIATIVFTALNFVGSGSIYGFFGILVLLFKMAVVGYLFSFLQTIVHATASGDDEMPGLPSGDDVFGAFFELAGAVAISFGLAIGLAVAKMVFDVGVPAAALVVAILFGCLYFPMAFLAVAMKDSVLAANPLVVVPSILKVPLEYLVTVILLMVVYGFRALGDFTMGLMFFAGLTSKSMSVFLGMAAARAFWAFVSLYLLTVMMRALGLLYVTRKHKLGWFAH